MFASLLVSQTRSNVARIILIFTILTYGVISYSIERSCAKIFSSNTTISKTFDSFTVTIKGSQNNLNSEDVFSAFNRINDLFPGVLRGEFEIIFNSDRTEYVPGKSEKIYLAIPEITVLYHELGHHLYDQLVAQRSAFFKDLITYDRSIRMINEDARQLLLKYSQNGQQQFSAADNQHLIENSQKSTQAMLKKQMLTLKLKIPGETLDGLSELFSDTVAIVATADLEAMMRVALKQGQSSKNAMYRSFAAELPAEGWNEPEKHDFFSPVRSFLGKEIINHYSATVTFELLLSSINQLVTTILSSDKWLQPAINKELIEQLHVSTGKVVR
jgi:hypothetical protein